ncbi:glucose 1-dehydrogenase [Desulfallas sp. Bu1-1]|uniref:SDR family NAD(P)-dependent oxidoreductase n=1 Tax=Desulfallas sp. Bu1-1 TaxID=2787620 RepID=UPI00189E1CAD|nr:glucose 1-dehydrogenase [Desulfallas sp. Bu1-1]MBF7083667.1 glucose 1-dehydrogenase [Desulfallas sp. Bu1-1]
MLRTEDLIGKTALITGGSKGIGKAIAMLLAGAGCSVAIASRNLDEVSEVARQIREQGGNALALRTDVTQKKDVVAMVEEVIREFSRIDVLINNAGTNIRKPLLELTEDEWDIVMGTNLKGVFLVGQQVGQFMVRQKKGKIINVASVAGVRGRPNLGAYCASKGGVIQLTKVMALEWAEHNVQVNAIAPTYIETPLTSEYLKQVKDQVLKRIPVGRLGTTEDLEGVVLLLSTRASDFITGQTFFIDGGGTAF